MIDKIPQMRAGSSVNRLAAGCVTHDPDDFPVLHDVDGRVRAGGHGSGTDCGALHGLVCLLNPIFRYHGMSLLVMSNGSIITDPLIH